ncbi:MAG TPA: hypothetical protein VGH44_01905 [Candidatus Saccharimonadia bacterium]|jgi:hypothetical protein
MSLESELPSLHAALAYQTEALDLLVIFTTEGLEANPAGTKYTLSPGVTVTFARGSYEPGILEVTQLRNVSPAIKYLIHNLIGSRLAGLVEAAELSEMAQFLVVDPEEAGPFE